MQRKLALSEADLLEDVERSEALSDSVENLKSWADRAEDVDVRRRLRDEIRRRVRRIDLFPNGFKKLWILPRPGFDLRFSTAKLSVFRVTFVNGVARWVFPLPKSVFNMCMAEPSKDDVAESNSSSAITLVTLPG